MIHSRQFDIVISCTASTLPLIGLGAVETALKQRKNRPMLMIDLAVPRDIEAEVSKLESVYFYNVDDLAKVIRSAHEVRQSAVKDAELIIDAGVAKFNQWLDQRRHVPLIQMLTAQTEDWRVSELAKAKKLIDRGESVDMVLDSMSKALIKKLMHGPMSQLNSHDPQARSEAKAALENMFLRRSI